MAYDRELWIVGLKEEKFTRVHQERLLLLELFHEARTQKVSQLKVPFSVCSIREKKMFVLVFTS